MRALVMRGVIVTGMMVMAFTRGHLYIAQNECETSTHRRQHEARWNERPKEQQPEDKQRRPSWIPNVPHPFHRCADLRTISANLYRAFGGILPFFGTLRTLESSAGQSAHRNPRAIGNRR